MTYLLPQILNESARRFPENIAVWAQNRTLTYRELEERSNQLAHLLRARGIKKGDRVGLYFSKSVESVISMFGVLKAGVAYVPLDPHAPVRRIEYIIGNCGLKALITTHSKLQTLASGILPDSGFTLLLDGSDALFKTDDAICWDALSAFPSSYPPACDFIETDLAYILYTSGSTGDPKGVMISHRNALTFINWCAETFRIRPDDRLSNHAPHHFDLSVFDIYNSILAGAAVHMISEEVALFPARLAEFIEEHRITVWYSVPSALIYLLLHGDLAHHSLNSLRMILFAGEPFAIKYLRQLAGNIPGAELYNLYGPTETNVCTYYCVDRSVLQQLDQLPIGKACSNTDVFAVNEDGKLISPGETGELCVRGPSVTKGYWADREKTQRAVVRNPFQAHFSEDIYRTGDVVMLDEHGTYWYVGRRDSMIKSRGYRIELGEIETALYAHTAVKEAAVVAMPDQEIGNRIKAFVCTLQPGMLTKFDLQTHCASRIPKYMVPESIEFCEELPKTSTGKVDRKRLAQGKGVSFDRGNATEIVEEREAGLLK
jgi:amino acid adenylation domain-containing protein